jgi:hypothetical protein
MQRLCAGLHTTLTWHRAGNYLEYAAGTQGA